jgi:hypothetical protein
MDPGARVALDLLDNGERTPDDRADLSTVCSIPDTTGGGSICRGRDDLDEVLPFTGFPVGLVLPKLVVCQPGSGADVGRVAIVPIEDPVEVAVLVTQPGLIPLHDDSYIPVRPVPGTCCTRVRGQVSSIITVIGRIAISSEIVVGVGPIEHVPLVVAPERVITKYQRLAIEIVPRGVGKYTLLKRGAFENTHLRGRELQVGWLGVAAYEEEQKKHGDTAKTPHGSLHVERNEKLNRLELIEDSFACVLPLNRTLF